MKSLWALFIIKKSSSSCSDVHLIPEASSGLNPAKSIVSNKIDISVFSFSNKPNQYSCLSGSI